MAGKISVVVERVPVHSPEFAVIPAFAGMTMQTLISLLQTGSCHRERLLERDEYGFFAYCPDLPGCHTQGETFEEAVENIREAADLYLETLDEEARHDCMSREIINLSLEVASA